MTGHVVLVAPAKLTVSLRVLGLRPDGYHELEAEMVSLDLCDRLVVDPAGHGIEVSVGGPWGGALTAGADNLVARALALAGRTAHVHLEKRIPVGGGLGGGSADAAAVLLWAGRTDLAEAAGLGADVPFCVRGGRALVRGVGERVEPLPFVERSFVLLVPPFPVDTAAAYRAWDALAAERRAGVEPDAGNDLTAPALMVEPRLARWRDLFAEATGRRPALAGSGSTWWVEGSPDEVGLDEQRSLVLGRDEGRLVPVRTVPENWSGPSDGGGAPV
jgi:4-diphosphocytidyl-2-C-methyl-D-erythritol kinase